VTAESLPNRSVGEQSSDKENEMRRIIGAVALVAIVGAGCGADKNNSSTSAGPATTQVEITMTDNAYSPNTVTVPQGEKVVLKFTNSGSVEHEAIIGDTTVQNDHAQEMMDGHTMSGMGGDASDRTVTVKPGKTAEIITAFDTAGTLIIGCHKTGHYEAGMKATLKVT
jgi:uncharacterized cupredoxin-like copper-binding protein